MSTAGGPSNPTKRSSAEVQIDATRRATVGWHQSEVAKKGVTVPIRATGSGNYPEPTNRVVSDDRLITRSFELPRQRGR